MNLKLIDAAIADYQGRLDAGDIARLDFFRALWGALDECVSKADLPAYAAPDAGTVKRSCETGVPVFAAAPVAVDGALLSTCAKRLAQVAVDRHAFSDEVCEALAAIDWASAIEPNIAGAGADPTTWLADLEERVVAEGVDEGAAHVGALLVSMALRAQLEVPARLVMSARKNADVRADNPLTCPVCGSAPMMAHVGGLSSTAGRGRSLVCPQCASVWEFERVRCARCGTRNQAHLHFFSIDGDDAHRLAVCDECDGYIRTLYSEDALAMCSYDVEDVVMAKLDALALDPRIASRAKASK